MFAQQGIQGQDSAFAVIVGPKGYEYIFDGRLESESPNDAR